MKIIVTTGEAFVDIDAFACAAGYSELLKLQGFENEVVFPGVLNSSVPQYVQEMFNNFKPKPTFQNYKVVVVDVSEPDYIAKFAKIEDIYEIFDHRYGFQDFWNDKLSKKSHIELVGAYATLIWEEFRKNGCSNQISTSSANLLSIAILSNTLNFNSSVTTERDIAAFDELKQFTDLKDSWQGNYFAEVEKTIFENFKNALIADTKEINCNNMTIVMGQLELWNGNSIGDKYFDDIVETMNSFQNKDWFLSIPSISENKNYIITTSDTVKELLKKIITINFDSNIGITDKLWLRKEIRKKILEL